MDFEKFLKMDNKKKAIALAVVVAIIIIILLLLRSCGGKKVDDGNLGGDANASLTTSVAGDNNDGDDITPDPADIGYDEELVSTWYKDDVAMVIAEQGYGDLYYGDSDGGTIQWYTSGNNLYLTTNEGASVATYSIDGDTLTLKYKDGKTETWIR